HAAHCAAAGGESLLPGGSLPGITVACFDYGATGIEQDYRSLVDGRGPEEVFRAVNDAIPALPGKSLGEMLELSALAGHDPLTFQLMLPYLRQLAPGFDGQEVQLLAEEIFAVWETYFPAGVAGEADLGYELGVLSILIGDLGGAIEYLSGSIELLGPSTGPQFTLAACYEGVGKPELAVDLLQQVVNREPMNGPAREMLMRCMQAASGPRS
ncbi:MAG TPA: hypothetical protein VHL54_04650, partial [Actinomycetota bacterium]|nr:hypothetical protein [Actinomycetota bacterium]